MMENELIELAHKKGFEDTIFFDSFYLSGEDEFYIFLCELQKWLEDTKSLFVIITPNISKKVHFDKVRAKLIYNINVWELEKLTMHLVFEDYASEKRYVALETGCYEALKLIE